MICQAVPTTESPFLKAWISFGVVRPVLADVGVLLLEQVDRGLELLVVERVRVLDAQVGLGRHQVDGGVGDVDRRVVGRHLARVVRRVVEDGRPRVGRRRHDLGVVHQQVGATAVRDAVGDPVDAVPRLHLQRVEDVGVVGHQVGVDRLDVAGRDQPQRRVAGGRNDVVLAGLHQVDHVVGGRCRLDVDLAAGLLLERRHPVDGRVGAAVLGVAGPGDDVQLALGLAQLLECLQVRRVNPWRWRRCRSCLRRRRPRSGPDARGERDRAAAVIASSSSFGHQLPFLFGLRPGHAVDVLPPPSPAGPGCRAGAAGRPDAGPVFCCSATSSGPASSLTTNRVDGPA